MAISGDAQGAVLLDLDGTLVDTNYHHGIAWYRAFRAHGIVLPLLADPSSRGDGRRPARPRARRRAVRGGEGRRAPAGPRRGVRPPGRRGRRHSRERTSCSRPCTSCGHEIVLASSSQGKYLDRYLDLLDAHDLIDAATTADDVERSKPAPDLIQVAKEKARTDARGDGGRLALGHRGRAARGPALRRAPDRRLLRVRAARHGGRDRLCLARRAPRARERDLARPSDVGCSAMRRERPLRQGRRSRDGAALALFERVWPGLVVLAAGVFLLVRARARRAWQAALRGRGDRRSDLGARHRQRAADGDLGARRRAAALRARARRTPRGRLGSRPPLALGGRSSRHAAGGVRPRAPRRRTPDRLACRSGLRSLRSALGRRQLRAHVRAVRARRRTRVRPLRPGRAAAHTRVARARGAGGLARCPRRIPTEGSCSRSRQSWRSSPGAAGRLAQRFRRSPSWPPQPSS